MPRYMFKIDDLAPLSQILARPEAQRLLARAIPVKRYDPPPGAVEVIPDRLPVKLRTRDNPDGVPLGDVNILLKERVPGVRSMFVRDGSVLVEWNQKPTDGDRAKLRALLADTRAFQTLQDKVTRPPPLSDDELKAKLLSPRTSDAEWLRTFRSFQTTQMTKPK